ncbi:MAG TPA: HYR domain-containing protein, partial [Bacteroidales bacterium]|nr:HYR domain-containing protein [Bacteroidales bacterium]
GQVVYTYRYTACDNTTTADWIFTYTIDYSDGLTPPQNGAATVSCPSQAVDPGPPASITDACGRTVLPVLVVPAPSAPNCEGQVVYTYRYTACDNTTTADWTFTYTIDYNGGLTPPQNGASTVTCPSQAVDPGPPAAITDACGRTVLPVLVVPTPTAPNCEGQMVYTYRYTACDNTTTADWTFTYTIDYSGSLTPPQNGAATVSCPSQAVDPGPPAAITDACGRTVLPVLIVPTPTPPACEGQVVYTYRYTACDNTTTADWTFTYTIDLNTPPQVPANGTAFVNSVFLAISPSTPQVVDACGNTLTAVLVSIVDQPDPIVTTGTREYTYSYTDCAGNFSTWKFIYTVLPGVTPVFPTDGAAVVQCPSNATIPAAPVYVDQCYQIVTPVFLGYADSPNPIVCEGTRTYSFSYTDCANQIQIWKFIYTIDLTTPPVVPSNGTATVNCLFAAVTPSVPVVTDYCGRVVTPTLISVVNTPQPLTCEGTRVYTYSYKDCALNTSTWKFTYTIDRSTPPAPAGTPVPSSAVISCASQAIPPSQLPVIKDACNSTLVPSGPVVGGSYNGCEGTITYTYSYTDCAGLLYNWTYTYTVSRNNPPVLPLNGASVVQCLADAVTPVAPGAVDECNNPVQPQLISVVDNPLPLSCEGTRTYTFAYTDCSQNTSYWSHTYTIDISTAPQVPVSGYATVPVVSLAILPIPPVVNDACGNSVTAQMVSVTDNPNPLVNAGTRIYLFSYTDCGGNSATWSFTYTIDPTLINPFPQNGGSVVQCINDAIPPQAPAYTDYCGFPVIPVFTGYSDSPAPLTCEGTRVYSYQYTDCLNQTYIWQYTYTVDLTSPPVVPANGSSVVECMADAILPPTPAVTDYCGNPIQPVLISTVDVPDPLSCFGSRTYTFQYTDCSQNSVQWTYTYTVSRTTPPGQAGSPVQNTSLVSCVAQAQPPVNLPVVLDACGNTLTPSGPVSGGNYNGCEGTIIYTYTYSDCAALQYVWEYTYTVDLTNPPVVPANGSASVECLSAAIPPAVPVVTDACGNTLTASLVNMVTVPASLTCQGTVDYSYLFSDCAQNSVVWHFTYTVNRITPPSISGLQVVDHATVSCLTDAIPPQVLPSVTDVCGNVLIPGAPVIGGTGTPCGGTVTYAYPYADCQGLIFTWVFTYTVSDQIAPIVTCVAPQQRNAGAGQNFYTAVGTEFDPVSFTDNCGSVQISNNLNGLTSLAGYQFATGQTMVVWTATDQCGNTSTCSFTVDVSTSLYSGCIEPKVFMQGPYDVSTGLMWDSLRVMNFIPLTDPYGLPPYNTTFVHAGGGGGETIANPAVVLGVTGSNAIVDWVFIELRSAADSTQVVYTRSALLQRDGDIVDMDGISPLCFTNLQTNQFYVVVRHRNHLGVMTASPVTLSSQPVAVDFRYGQQQEYSFGTALGNGIDYTGLAQKTVATGVRALWAGNALIDQKLKYQGSGSDRNAILSQVLSHPNNTYLVYNYAFGFGYFSGDNNMDGKVKYQGAGNDATIILSNVLNFLPGNTASFDFLYQQLPQ